MCGSGVAIVCGAFRISGLGSWVYLPLAQSNPFTAALLALAPGARFEFVVNLHEIGKVRDDDARRGERQPRESSRDLTRMGNMPRDMHRMIALRVWV